MSASSDLIERMEQETGQRIGDNEGENMAIAGLLGALSRMMGHSPSSYRERDDVPAGVLISHQLSPKGQREHEDEELSASLLVSGMSPDDIKGLFGENNGESPR